MLARRRRGSCEAQGCGERGSQAGMVLSPTTRPINRAVRGAGRGTPTRRTRALQGNAEIGRYIRAPASVYENVSEQRTSATALAETFEQELLLAARLVVT
ncbi:MAG: hypothetical protein ACYC0H_19535 [Solirubrobacteraceae bacterium]